MKHCICFCSFHLQINIFSCEAGHAPRITVRFPQAAVKLDPIFGVFVNKCLIAGRVEGIKTRKYTRRCTHGVWAAKCTVWSVFSWGAQVVLVHREWNDKRENNNKRWFCILIWLFFYFSGFQDKAESLCKCRFWVHGINISISQYGGCPQILIF